ncbi:MAG: radical SAM protein, partial [Thermofilaceae archaeon]
MKTGLKGIYLTLYFLAHITFKSESRWYDLVNLKNFPTVKESVLYEKAGRKVRCCICERRCIIEEDSLGFCGTRINIEGHLYTLTYGDISVVESRPIEIKPFYHFWPGSISLTFSTWSCNFTCPWCQNWQLSKTLPQPAKARYVSPDDLIKKALGKNQGICVSFNEPLMLFEYSLDVFKLARAFGLYCTYVSNGYMTLEALRRLHSAGLNGLKIDVKGGEQEYRKYNNAISEIVWRNAREAKRTGIHV